MVPALKIVSTQDNLGFKNRELGEYRRGVPSSAGEGRKALKWGDF